MPIATPCPICVYLPKLTSIAIKANPKVTAAKIESRGGPCFTTCRPQNWLTTCGDTYSRILSSDARRVKLITARRNRCAIKSVIGKACAHIGTRILPCAEREREIVNKRKRNIIHRVCGSSRNSSVERSLHEFCILRLHLSLRSCIRPCSLNSIVSYAYACFQSNSCRSSSSKHCTSYLYHNQCLHCP